MKSALIYNPYWSTLGGGEKYTATVVRALLNHNYQVDIAANNPHLTAKILERFNLDISLAHVSSSILKGIKSGNLVSKYFLTHKYDLIFWVTDGSVPFLFGKNNLLHFQVPFQPARVTNLDKIKFATINHIICNSGFTKKVIDNSFHLNSQVLYPPATQFSPAIKQNLILSVGRLDSALHSKRQDFLINLFKKFDFSNYKLVIAGGVIDPDKLKLLVNQAIGANIEIISNPSFLELSKLYESAKIYWHAAGLGVDAVVHPEQTEHFGISTVEAMSSGAIPVVFNAGGQTEIVNHGENGFLWNNESQLVEYTRSIINQTVNVSKISKQAIIRAKDFSEDKFYESIETFIS